MSEKVVWDIKWRNVILLGAFHIITFYTFYIEDRLIFSKHAVFYYIVQLFFALGTTAAAHRYFTHKTFTANRKLKVLLLFLQTGSMQDNVINWVRDHTLHHKFLDTNADPYNSKRGLFFSHMGWLFIKKHPDVFEKAKLLDFSRVLDDPMLQFQKK
jgi:stearoyl-CoA desaturase (delta-9 desaturase)